MKRRPWKLLTQASLLVLFTLAGLTVTGCGGSSTSADSIPTSPASTVKFDELTFSDFTPSERKAYLRAYRTCMEWEKAYEYSAIGNYLKKATISNDEGATYGCTDGSAEPPTPLKGSGLP